MNEKLPDHGNKFTYFSVCFRSVNIAAEYCVLLRF